MSMVKISLSWPEKFKSRKTFSACVLSLMYDGKDFAELVLTPQCRWLVMDIYLAASRLGKCPPLDTSTSVNSC